MVATRSNPSAPKPTDPPPTPRPFAGPNKSTEENRFAIVRIRFEIPHTLYLYPFSRAHPEIVIELTATQNLSRDRVLAEFDLIEPNPADHTDGMRSLSGVVSISRLAPVGPRTRYQAVAAKPSYLVLVDELEVLCRYPRLVQNGEHTIEVASRVAQLRTLVTELRQLSPDVTVIAFGRDRMRTSPLSLTPRQHALLHEALAAGYYDVPRRVSLTEFARRRGRSKSTTSRALATIEKALAEGSVLSGR